MDLRDQLQTTLGDSYSIEQELGGGGMSRVFVAVETSLGRKVVVKVLPGEMSGQVSIDRFKREIALAAQLQHPHIVPLLTAGETDGLPYFTMPYVRGESLRVRLAKHGEMPVNEAIRVLREVASALAFAHEQGIVHRDIKPDNILLAGDAAMVTDFGVAKALSASTGGDADHITSLGVALGTPAYMSPEQATASPIVDHRSDLYAWGVLAYELLTGSTPFAGRPIQAQLAAHVTEEPDDIRKRRPSIPPAVGALVMQCLAKRAADRPQSALDVVHALDALATPTHGSVPTHHASSAPASTGVALSGRAIAAIAAAIVVVAIVYMVRGSTRGIAGDAVPRSVAVLPFENVGGDTAVEYFSDGLTDGLRGALQEAGVRVAARTSSNSYKGKKIDLAEVTKTLNVGTVLTGQVRHLGPRLSVSVDLESGDGFSIWHKTVERQTSDAQAVQQELLADLANALRARLATGRAARPRHHQPDAQTYDLYLRAIHARDLGTREGFERAIGFLRQAIARDSAYAEAWSALAYVYAQQADAVYAPNLVIPKAVEALNRAITLDSNLASAHMGLGAIRDQYMNDWRGSLEALARAIQLDSTNADAYFFRTLVMITTNQRERALRDLQRANELDPLSSFTNHFAVFLYTALDLPDSAIAQHRRAVAIDSAFIYLEDWVGEAYRMKGQLGNALAIERNAAKRLGRPTAGLVITLVRMGQRDEALSTLRDLERRSAPGSSAYVVPELIARASLVLGDKKKAIDYLERGAELQSACMQCVTWYPEFRQLRGDPRFERHLERIHVKEFMR